MNYKTTNMYLAATLLSQAEFMVDFIGLIPTDHPNKFKFNLEVHTEKQELDDWIRRYLNQRTSVEPKHYDSKINVLRDTLTLQKQKGE